MEDVRRESLAKGENQLAISNEGAQRLSPNASGRNGGTNSEQWAAKLPMSN
jgi:hypothetical protein